MEFTVEFYLGKTKYSFSDLDRLMFEILGGGTEGWNSLFEPVDKTCYPEIVSVLEELKASEERNVELAKCVADGI